jgi:transcriptional regulator with XRE-family HTH domain
VKLPDIHNWRVLAGMSKYASAKALGVTNSTYDRWESFPGKVTLDNFIRLYNLFSIKEDSTTDKDLLEELVPIVEIQTKEPIIPEAKAVISPTNDIIPEVKAEIVYNENPIDPGIIPIEDGEPLPADIDSEKIDRLKSGVYGFPAKDAIDTLQSFCKSFDLTQQQFPTLLNKVYPDGAPASLKEYL